jgi:hypothetical protein
MQEKYLGTQRGKRTARTGWFVVEARAWREWGAFVVRQHYRRASKVSSSLLMMKYMETHHFCILLNFNDSFLYVIRSEYFDIFMFKIVPYEWSLKGLKPYLDNGASVFMYIDAPELCHA